MSFSCLSLAARIGGPIGSARAMVDTPWGRSETLRERKLPPGPGTPAEVVARNQRGRLFGAMVASVVERGYAATRIADLTELSGVARKSFYGLFADKEECFVAAMETMLGAAIQTTERPSGSWEDQIRIGAAAFAELIVAQPAAARMCLIEAYVVGPAGVKPLEAAIAHFEAHALAAALEAGMDAETLPALIRGQVGGLLEIARNRLRLGREGELPGLMEGFADVLLLQSPPPQPLRLTTRRPPPAPAAETVDPYGHVERVLQAFAAVAAEHGYANTTIELLLKQASMSPTTFYANFASKEDVLMAAIDGAGAQLVAAILPAFRRNPNWAQGVRAAYGAFFDFLASRPALARLALVEVYGAGPAALDRREEALRPLRVLLAEGRARAPQVPRIAAETIVGGTYALAYRQVRDSGPESLPGLAPVCTYLTLVPFIGPEEACEAANGDGRTRGSASDSDRPDRLLLSQVLVRLSREAGSATDVSAEIGVPLETARRTIGDLEQAEFVTPMEGELGSGGEPRYRSRWHWVEDTDWDQMSLSERQLVSRQVGDLITAELDLAIDTGTFDARTDRHLSRVPLLVDEQGWRKLMGIHHQAFLASLEVQSECAERLKGSDKPAIEGRSVQILFEVPRSGLSAADIDTWDQLAPGDEPPSEEG
jgi:AcrR family transcriptional regulator